MNWAFRQFGQQLGDPRIAPVTKKTQLHEYVNDRINDENCFNRSTSENNISQFEQILKQYIPGQGFVDFSKLPIYSTMDKKSYSPSIYEGYLAKEGAVAELFEHYLSHWYYSEVIQGFERRIMSEAELEAVSISYIVPRQIIPLFCASIYSLFERKSGKDKDKDKNKKHGPVYTVTKRFICQSEEIISSFSFHELLKEIDLDDPEVAELFFCWNMQAFYSDYRIGLALFKEQFGIKDRIPAEGYIKNFNFSLEKRLGGELPACGGYISVLLGWVGSLLSCLDRNLFFNLVLLFLADYLKFILGTGTPGPADERREERCFERFRSIEFFCVQVLYGALYHYRVLDYIVPDAPSPDYLLSMIKNAGQTILSSPLYDPELFFLFQMFDSCKTGELKMTDDKKIEPRCVHRLKMIL